MSTEEAQAFAVEIAKLISSDVYPQTPTPNAVSFSHLAERTAGG